MAPGEEKEKKGKEEKDEPQPQPSQGAMYSEKRKEKNGGKGLCIQFQQEEVSNSQNKRGEEEGKRHAVPTGQLSTHQRKGPS